MGLDLKVQLNLIVILLAILAIGVNLIKIWFKQYDKDRHNYIYYFVFNIVVLLNISIWCYLITSFELFMGIKNVLEENSLNIFIDTYINDSFVFSILVIMALTTIILLYYVVTFLFDVIYALTYFIFFGTVKNAIGQLNLIKKIGFAIFHITLIILSIYLIQLYFFMQIIQFNLLPLYVLTGLLAFGFILVKRGK
ncbi:putative membrane protein (plasmid) [Malaciobacter mytili LMG 24559]|uniref:hypothetical protein n=2 Tax=Malaciobacter mytili TaxID=603050 RepID=UPI000E0C92EE|nr:hypothetical protein [Malaciobacter mytili]AXH16442.1 putative membrane protein [Malaciobacter mytili LMG 24559]